eukprot:c7004_g1_i1.p1 GENE.c7004_g1_i1~~c7004_g1_i1.p1  ORF type:complete len:443 (+),score=119.45 c7004_g1_i1:33-1361(+)
MSDAASEDGSSEGNEMEEDEDDELQESDKHSLITQVAVPSLHKGSEIRTSYSGQYIPPPQTRTQPPPPPTAVCFDEPSVPAFLLKLYTMLEDPNTDDIIAWSPKGDTFIVFKPSEFANLVLPQFFKHSNFQSFIRQLNLYGFHKLKQSANWNEFSHDMFKRGHKHLLKDIKRKIPASGKSKKDPAVVPKKHQFQQQQQLMEEPIREQQSLHKIPPAIGLLERLSKLEKQNDLLTKENRVLWNEVLTIHDSQKKVAQKLQSLLELLNQILAVQMPGGMEHKDLQMLSDDSLSLGATDSSDLGLSRKSMRDDMLGLDPQNQMLEQVQAEVRRRGLSGQYHSQQRIGSSGSVSTGVGAPTSRMMNSSQMFARTSVSSDSMNEKIQNSAATRPPNFDQWLQLNRSHRQDQAEHIRRIDDIEHRLLAGGFDVDNSDLSEYVTPTLPS